jgi:hypothetical protein
VCETVADATVLLRDGGKQTGWRRFRAPPDCLTVAEDLAAGWQAWFFLFRRANQQQVVAPCGNDFQCTFSLLLANNIAQIR